jgi:hypothetical protein
VTGLSEALGVSTQVLRPVLDELQALGVLTACRVTKDNGQKYRGFKLADLGRAAAGEGKAAPAAGDG